MQRVKWTLARFNQTVNFKFKWFHPSLQSSKSHFPVFRPWKRTIKSSYPDAAKTPFEEWMTDHVECFVMAGCQWLESVKKASNHVCHERLSCDSGLCSCCEQTRDRLQKLIQRKWFNQHSFQQQGQLTSWLHKLLWVVYLQAKHNLEGENKQQISNFLLVSAGQSAGTCRANWKHFIKVLRAGQTFL